MAPYGMFCGRWEEVRATEKSLFQTKHGNPKHFLVSGERGIGKSSLFLMLDLVAKGTLKPLDDQTMLNFISISVELVGSTTYEEIVTYIAQEFKAEVARRNPAKTLATQAFDFITQWKVMGVEYKGGQAEDSLSLIDSLCGGMSTFLSQAGDTVDGILILIDEADKPAEQARLGEFCKIFTEKLTRLGCHRVCIGLAGLPPLSAKLRASHESSPRIFEALNLQPIEDGEVKEVVLNGLAEAHEKDGKETKIEPMALDLIATLSEGYPHFVQQFSYSAFDCDTDYNITTADVQRGAFGENGALDQLGLRYFSEMYFDNIGSPDYRRVLNSMAEHLDGWVARGEIIRTSGVKETQVTNALRMLRERRIIISNDQKQGEYRLPTRSFAVWIKALQAKQDAVQKGSPT